MSKIIFRDRLAFIPAIGLCFIGLLAGACVPIPASVAVEPAPSVTRAAPAGPAGDAVRLVNAERQRAGIAPLSWSPELARAAESHARYMASSGAFSHRGPGGGVLSQVRAQGYRSCAATQNIARGPLSPAGVVRIWQESPNHAVNNMREVTHEVGAAVVSGSGGDNWVMTFGSRCREQSPFFPL